MVAAKKSIPKELTQMARDLRAMADQYHWLPTNFRPPDERHCRYFVFNQHRIKVQFTRTEMGNLKIYHLSIGSMQGIENVPESIIKTIQRAFFPSGDSVEFPSQLGNSRQFIEEIK